MAASAMIMSCMQMLIRIRELAQVQTKLFGTIAAVVAVIVIWSSAPSADAHRICTDFLTPTGAHVLTEQLSEAFCARQEILFLRGGHEWTSVQRNFRSKYVLHLVLELYGHIAPIWICRRPKDFSQAFLPMDYKSSRLLSFSSQDLFCDCVCVLAKGKHMKAHKAFQDLAAFPDIASFSYAPLPRGIRLLRSTDSNAFFLSFVQRSTHPSTKTLNTKPILNRFAK